MTSSIPPGGRVTASARPRFYRKGNDMTIAEKAGIDRWFNYALFYEFIAGYNFKKYAEVGVFKGHSISFLAQAIKNKKGVEIYGIDTWAAPEIKEMYDYNKKHWPEKIQDMITEIQGESVEVAEQFEDGYLDFVFLDADHAYEAVKADILAWLPKVRKGGILAGHDYVLSQPGVTKAVNELFGKNKKVQVDYDIEEHNINGEYFLERFPKSYCWYVEKKV